MFAGLDLEHKKLSGKNLASSILADIKLQIDKICEKRKPTLAVILVGENLASKIYVKNKIATCKQVGINSIAHILPEDTNAKQLLEIIQQLNLDDNVDGILVQLPLPKHLNSSVILETILPSKDVDGFHSLNMGALALNRSLINPCTPYGIIQMLNQLNIEYKGLFAVILGSSNIVGRPMALEFLNRGATVTICNSKTKNLPAVTRLADVLVVAIGKPNLVKSDWVKNDSIIIDVGINRLPNGTLCGDVDFTEVIKKVKYITPVPGGVGPMTIAMLVKNTLWCYHKNISV